MQELQEDHNMEVFRYHLEDCEGYQHEVDTNTSESEQEI